VQSRPKRELLIRPLEDTQPTPTLHLSQEISAESKSPSAEPDVHQPGKTSQAASTTNASTEIPTISSRPTRQGSGVASTFAALICFLDGILLLVIALMQIGEGDFGVLVGLWNLGVTIAYLAAAGGLASQKEWGYNWGLGLATANIGFLFMQAVFWGNLVGASEEQLYPLCILIAGDIVLAATLLAVKNMIAPPPKPEEIATPATLITELEQASQEKPQAPLSCADDQTLLEEPTILAAR
jgi:hypothetical protein